MSRILLIDVNQTYATALAHLLEASKYLVTVRNSMHGVLKELIHGEGCFDVVVLDMSDNRPENWQSLDAIQNAGGVNALGPMILCFSQIYRGPQLRLKVERKGVRFVYVR